MLKQSYSTNELKGLLTKKDIVRYRAGRSEEEILQKVEELSIEIQQQNFELDDFKVLETKSGKLFISETLKNELALKN